MICARAKGGKRKLKLVACDAARRFKLRHERSANAWLPLVLRWRQRRAARPDVRADRKSSSTHELFFPQSHFYFVTHASGFDRQHSTPQFFRTTTIHRERVTLDRGRTKSTIVYRTAGDRAHRSAASRLFAPLSVYRERMNLDRNVTNVLTINRVSEPSPAHCRSLINYASRRPLPGLIIERIESLTRFRSAQPLNDLIQRSSRRPSAKQIRLAPRAAISREETTRLFKTQLRTREYQPMVLALRAPIPKSLAAARSSEKKSTRIQFEAPEELVWRRTQPPVTKFETRGRADIVAASRREPVRTAVEETSAQATAAATTRTAPQQITKLDPALVDRLTDDVIRRVEQRARIERQRRGL